MGTAILQLADAEVELEERQEYGPLWQRAKVIMLFFKYCPFMSVLLTGVPIRPVVVCLVKVS